MGSAGCGRVGQVVHRRGGCHWGWPTRTHGCRPRRLPRRDQGMESRPECGCSVLAGVISFMRIGCLTGVRQGRALVCMTLVDVRGLVDVGLRHVAVRVHMSLAGVRLVGPGPSLHTATHISRNQQGGLPTMPRRVVVRGLARIWGSGSRYLLLQLHTRTAVSHLHG